jgi:hypothetical protein
MEVYPVFGDSAKDDVTVAEDIISREDLQRYLTTAVLPKCRERLSYSQVWL